MEADGLQSPAATSSFLEPEADPKDVVALIEKAHTQGVTELWLVAHNPLLSTLLSLLVEGECQSQSPLATAENLDKSERHFALLLCPARSVHAWRLERQMRRHHGALRPQAPWAILAA